MLKLHATNVMGRLHVSIHCYAHGDHLGHLLWSRSGESGPEDPAHELIMIGDAAVQAVRDWQQGLWEFSDDC
jgi:hypothetical protein